MAKSNAKLFDDIYNAPKKVNLQATRVFFENIVTGKQIGRAHV